MTDNQFEINRAKTSQLKAVMLGRLSPDKAG